MCHLIPKRDAFRSPGRRKGGYASSTSSPTRSWAFPSAIGRSSAKLRRSPLHTVAAFVLVAVAVRVALAPAEQRAAPDRYAGVI